MNINYRGEGWSPIYFDPEFDEMLELTKSFDTLRIGFHKEKNKTHLVVASGLGNTHSTLSRAIGELNPRCKPSRTDGLKYGGLSGGSTILYEEDGRFWFNMDEMGEKIPTADALPYFGEPARTILKEIVKLAEEQLNKI